MSRYFIKLSYNGTNYHGWQVQPNGITVQQVINEALQILLKDKEINITGAGRTDTGVHAKNFFAHFDTAAEIPSDLVYKLNKYLRKDVVIHEIMPVKDDAHARFDAASRLYRYYVSTKKDPFKSEYSWYVYGELDVDKMNYACRFLYDYHDFTSFSKTNTQTKTNDCTIKRAGWESDGDMLIFTIQADRFLRNMVRAIVGTLVEIGRGNLNPADFKKIIEAKDRRDAGESVPAQGLFLEEINYPKDIFI